MVYKTHGVCSSAIEFEVKDGKVTGVRFVGGCSGNTQGVARLVEGMDVHEASPAWKASNAASNPPPVRISWQKP